MKKLMILGAGIYQVPLIQTAKTMGIYTIVVSIAGNYPGFALADKVYYENTTDYEKVLELARAEKIDGIVTAGTDVAVITIGKVCDAMGLTGLSFEAAQVASNKRLMKEKYEAAGVRTARFRLVKLADEAVSEIVKGLNFPLIFKAVDTSGSRGIMRVDSAEEFAAARENVAKYTKLDYYIVEEFIEGEEFGAQAFISNHKLQFILPHGDFVFHGATGVPVGHFAPYDLSENICEDARYQLEQAALAMGLNDCAINADFILSNGKVYVVELGGRSGATCLVELVSIYYGYDYYEKLILAALGEDVSFESEQAVPNASKLLMSDKEGRICSLCCGNQTEVLTGAGVNVAKLLEGVGKGQVCEVQFDYGIGETVRAFRIGPDRIGHVVTKGDTLDAAMDTLEKVLKEIVIEVK